MIRASLLTRRRRACLFSAGCLALGLVAASCHEESACGPVLTSRVLSERLTSSHLDKIDILLAIDNSRSMADKTQILAVAVPDLVRGLVNPPCLDQNGDPVTPAPSGPLAKCPKGTRRQTEPLLDVHVGVISSSLGGHGSDACSTAAAGKESNNDKAHLLARKDPTQSGEVETYKGLKFLAWDPAQSLDPPGEADIYADSAGDPGATALIPALREMVLGVGDIGCGYESQLESWYRFLVDPAPPEDVTLDADGHIMTTGVDKLLLDQRKAFLRPDSLLAIIMLSDENDCSIRESGQFYFAAQQKSSNGSPYHLPKARQICDQHPEDECCFSCGQSGPKDADGNPTCPPDPSCKTADGETAYLNETEDNINLRCFDQKRRFGIDFLYDTDRYVEALRSPTVTDRSGEVVVNPIFSDLDPGDIDYDIRHSSMVFLVGVVGVPWQDVARTNADGVPDLKSGLDSSFMPRGGFKDSDQMFAPLPGKDYNTWDLILGDTDRYPAADSLPRDPLMIESVEPRTGIHPVTGEALVPSSQALGNAINGHEYSIAKRDDLQYACIFPLVKLGAGGDLEPAVRDCTAPGSAACDCEDPKNDSPLCQVNPATGTPTDQVRAKAYPSLRELRVLKDAGSQGVVASVCPAQLDDPESADFGYRQAISALLDRLTPVASAQCLQARLNADEAGRVTCHIIEADSVGDSATAACNACEAPARAPLAQEHEGARQAIEESNPGRFNCFCEIPQLSGSNPGEPLWVCQNDPTSDPSLENGEPVDGYCYIDTEAGVGDPAVVEKCPDSEKRLLRFVGAGEARNGVTLFITCAIETEREPGQPCVD